MKNRYFSATVLAATLTLAACGGGDKVVSAISPVQAAAMVGVQAGQVTATAAAMPASATSAPVVQSAAAALAAPAIVALAKSTKADVTLVQLESIQTVTPGQEFNVVQLAVDCPKTGDEATYCAKSVPMGELGFNNSLELQNVKLFYNGMEVPSWTSHEGDLYRVTPGYLWQVYRTGLVQVVATLSPNAKSGVSSSTVAHAAVASFDKILLLVSATDKVTVLAQDFKEPVVIGNASQMYVQEVGDGGLVGRFDATCGQFVWKGCTLNSFNTSLQGLKPGSDVKVVIEGQTYFIGFASDEGQLWVDLQPQVGFWAGQTITVKVYGNMPSGYVQFYNLDTSSGGEKIAPRFQEMECGVSVVNENGCGGKG